MVVRDREGGAATDDETPPPVRPELVVGRDGRHAVLAVDVTGWCAEREVERLAHVPRLGEQEPRRDREVAEGVVAGAVRPPARDDEGNLPLHLEPPAERREEIEAPGVRVTAVAVDPAEGDVGEAVEDTVEGVEPALPRRASAALRRTDPGLVPPLLEEGAEGQGLPPVGIGVGITEERFLRRVEHRVFTAGRQGRHSNLSRYARGPARRRRHNDATEAQYQYQCCELRRHVSLLVEATSRGPCSSSLWQLPPEEGRSRRSLRALVHTASALARR